MEVAFFVPEASRKMTEPAEERSAATSGNLAVRILLTQLVLSMALTLLFWGMDGNVAAYSALLGGLTCVVPNAFLALRLALPRRDQGAVALVRAAYIGELGKVALTVLMFGAVFLLVRPLAAGPLFAGFVGCQLATFAGFLDWNKRNNNGTDG